MLHLPAAAQRNRAGRVTEGRGALLGLTCPLASSATVQSDRGAAPSRWRQAQPRRQSDREAWSPDNTTQHTTTWSSAGAHLPAGIKRNRALVLRAARLGVARGVRARHVEALPRCLRLPEAPAVAGTFRGPPLLAEAAAGLHGGTAVNLTRAPGPENIKAGGRGGLIGAVGAGGWQVDGRLGRRHGVWVERALAARAAHLHTHAAAVVSKFPTKPRAR